MYGHLQKGLNWKVGDAIQKGDQIGLLGNTGVSGAPHLHFQVMDGNSIGVAEGLPFEFEQFQLEGEFEDFEGDDDQFIIHLELQRFSPSQLIMSALPLQNTIIGFPE
jgi:murein DD-endopeptidase MepM/ murein hydrolase activator NlpD